jgi:hypothetical protein
VTGAALEQFDAADPAIVDRLSAGVDVTADNTTYRSMSARTTHPFAPAWRRLVASAVVRQPMVVTRFGTINGRPPCLAQNE